MRETWKTWQVSKATGVSYQMLLIWSRPPLGYVRPDRSPRMYHEMLWSAEDAIVAALVRAARDFDACPAAIRMTLRLARAGSECVAIGDGARGTYALSEADLRRAVSERGVIALVHVGVIQERVMAALEAVSS